LLARARPGSRAERALTGLTYEVQGGNKRALALDLKDPRGREIFLRLAASADVLVENYRAGALASLGLTDEVLATANRALIHCSLTGFGQRGPRAQVNAYDNGIQATSGVMMRTGTVDSPVKTGASFVDYASGWCAAFAIAAALFQRARDGRGQRIDCAMFDVALTMMGPELAASVQGGDPRRAEAGLGCYETADGLLMLGAFTPKQNRRLWEALGDPRFAALDSWDALWANAGRCATRSQPGCESATRRAGSSSSGRSTCPPSGFDPWTRPFGSAAAAPSIVGTRRGRRPDRSGRSVWIRA
jgi:crotonobetainyl-CoA:carnitine CoA-transferase CaiB-like acyl-CoA transferase